MALSNIFREPRRELTEQLVGTGVVGLGLGLGVSYPVAVWMGSWGGNPPPFAMRMLLAPLFLACCTGVLVLAALIIHALGEEVCDFLDRRGIRLRPRARY